MRYEKKIIGRRSSSPEGFLGKGGKRQTAYPTVKSFDSFLAKKALTAGSDSLFGPNYMGICGCSELNLSANMFYKAMIYFHLGA